MSKKPSLKKHIQEIIAEQAQLFPVGIQFASIIIEDKSLQQPATITNNILGKYNSDGNSSSSLYKHISRFTKPDTDEKDNL